MHVPLPALLVLAPCAFFSCAPRYSVDVSRFHQLPSVGHGESFGVKAPREFPGPETSQHIGRMTAGLQKYGWTLSNGGKPSYRVYMDWDISDGYTVHGVAPVYGKTSSGSTTNHYGSFNVSDNYSGSGGYRGSYSGTSTTSPTYGVVGTRPTTTTRFVRRLSVLIYGPDGKLVMDSLSLSDGTNWDLSEVLPVMIDGFLYKFPGESGKKIKYTAD